MPKRRQKPKKPIPKRTPVDRSPLLNLLRSRPPKSFYDIGVGEGDEYKLVKEQFPELSLFGCEPYKSERIKDFNGQLYPFGISPNEEEYLSVSKVGTENGSISCHDDPDCRNVDRVKCITLDDFDRLCGEPDEIFLWMDIEGFELQAILSGTRLLSSGRVSWINLETRDKPLADWCHRRQLDEVLLPLGFEAVLTYNPLGVHYDILYQKTLQ